MRILELHSWDVDYKEAVAIQKEMASRVRIAPIDKQPDLVAGLDCAFTRDGRQVIACIVVTRMGEKEPVEVQYALCPVTFPYIPGLLSFREIPGYIAAAKKLQNTPDVFIVDGQGTAHQRRIGIAAHLGLLLNRPTIGCAKSRLIGTFDEPANRQGCWSPLMDKGENIGAVLRTRAGVRPVFVSVGHRITLKESIDICISTVSRYRLPEPTRLAHNKVSELKRTLGPNPELEFDED